MTPAKHSFILAPISRVFVLTLVSLLILLLSAAPVSAALITVTGDCSFDEAIDNATDDDATHSDCTAGNGPDIIELTGNVTLTENVAIATDDSIEIHSSLTIEGGDHTLSGDNLRLTVSGPAQGTTPETYGAITVTINDLTLTNGNATSAEISLMNIDFNATVNINDSTFENISAAEGQVRGTAIQQEYSAGKLTISKSTFSGNSNTGDTLGGGALWVKGVADIKNSKFTNNSAEFSGGAIYISAGAVVNISGSTFTGNRSTQYQGGVIFAVGSTSSLNPQYASLTISNSVFSNNSAGLGTDPVLAHGGVINSGARPTNIYRSVFNGNEAGEYGGAIYIDSSTQFRLENSTFYENESNDEGGALYMGNSAAGDIRHVTFVNNEAEGSATDAKNGNAIFAHSSATARLYNSIIKTNTSHNGDDCSGLAANENTNNIIEDTSCSTSSAFSANPLLGERSGGARPYYPLLFGSPAINAADRDACFALNTRVDQRGVARPAGSACDIGAFEYPQPPTDDDDDGGGTGGDSGGVRVESAPQVPINRSLCAHCDELLAQGYRLSATHGLASGVQFRRLDSSGVGIQWVLDEGFRDAIDVWGFAEQGGEVCFPNSGRLLMLDAAHSPRQPVSVEAYSEAGLTCAAFDRAGTLVLLDGPPPPPVAALVQAPPGHQLLQGCMVTTNHIINFRESPGGALIHFVDPWGSPSAGWLPFNVTLTALERTERWFKVDYHGTQGWIHADYVTTHGTCG